MENIKILCSYTQLVQIEKLVENPKNPNKHPEKQIVLLSKIIMAQGFRRPIVVSKRSGFVIIGHGRLAAAKYLNMEAVPVDYQDYENEAAEWADMVADNKIAELAEFDNASLSDLLNELDACEDFDEELFGMVQSDIDKLMGRLERAEQKNNSQEIALNAFDDDKFEHCCPRCGFRF
nr:MAG TPA: ParB protein [Caudoviricetes sp.]